MFAVLDFLLVVTQRENAIVFIDREVREGAEGHACFRILNARANSFKHGVLGSLKLRVFGKRENKNIAHLASSFSTRVNTL